MMPASVPGTDRAGPMFAAAFARLAGDLALVEERAEDDAFLDDLAASDSPLAGLLPDAMIRQQAVFKRIGHRAAHPTAMRRLVVRDGVAIGHVAIDWGADASRCVDVAIVPAARGEGVGTALLTAWLATADRLGVPVSLSVAPGNPAIALYRRLGLSVVEGDGEPMLTMMRVGTRAG